METSNLSNQKPTAISKVQSRIAFNVTPMFMSVQVHRSQTAWPLLVRAAFIVFVLTLPFDKVTLFSDVKISLPKMAGYLFFASLALCPKRFMSRNPTLWPMTWFCGYLLVYVLGSVSVSEGALRPYLIYLFKLLQLVALFFAASALLTDSRIAKGALFSFVLACGFLAVASLVGLPGFVVEAEGKLGRATTLDLNENALGLLMAQALLCNVGLWQRGNINRQWQKILLLSLALPCLLVLFKSGSRAATGAFAVGFIMFLVPGTSLKKQIGIILAACAAAFVVLQMSDNVALERWTKTYTEGHQLSARDRIITASLEMIQERPLLGWNRYQGDLASRMGDGGSEAGGWNAHNDVMHVLLQVGVLGAIPFFTGVWIILWRSWRARKGSLGILPFALLLALLVNNMAHTGMDDKTTWLFFAFAAAAYATQKANEKRVYVPATILQSHDGRYVPAS